MKHSRLIIGKHQINPFAGLSDGDNFSDIYGQQWEACNQTLRPVIDGQVSYSQPCHPQFTNWNGFNDFAQRINYFFHNPNDLKQYESPKNHAKK